MAIKCPGLAIKPHELLTLETSSHFLSQLQLKSIRSEALLYRHQIESKFMHLITVCKYEKRRHPLRQIGESSM